MENAFLPAQMVRSGVGVPPMCSGTVRPQHIGAG